MVCGKLVNWYDLLCFNYIHIYIYTHIHRYILMIYIYAQRPPQGLPFFEYKNQFNQFICKNKQTHHHYLSAQQMYLSGQSHQVTCKQNMSGLTSLLFHHSASDQSTKMHQAKKTKPKKTEKTEKTEKPSLTGRCLGTQHSI